MRPRKLLRLLHLLFNHGGKDDDTRQSPAGRGGVECRNFGDSHPKLLNHGLDDSFGISLMTKAIRFREQVSFEGLCLGVDIANPVCPQEQMLHLAGITEAVLCQQIDGLVSGHPLRNRDRVETNVSFGQPLCHLYRCCRFRELVFTGLNMPPQIFEPDVDQKGKPVVQDPRTDQEICNLLRVRMTGISTKTSSVWAP